jgi:cytidylate kinase
MEGHRVIVSISRELGAGGGTVGEAVAKAVGAVFLDERAILNELAQRLRFSTDYLEKTIERPPTLGQTLIANLARSAAMMEVADVYQTREEEIIDTVRAIVLERAGGGHVVVIGHGGSSLLGWRPEGLLVVAILLKAGHKWRVAQLARRYSIDLEEAGRLIKRTDDARIAYQKHFFDSDMYDSRLYDLVFNTERLGLELTISLAVEAVQQLAGAEQKV